MLNWPRALWRGLFQPEPPPRLDGPIIQLRTTLACGLRGEQWSAEEWQRQNRIRGAENRKRIEAWRRGERVPQ